MPTVQLKEFLPNMHEAESLIPVVNKLGMKRMGTPIIPGLVPHPVPLIHGS